MHTHAPKDITHYISDKFWGRSRCPFTHFFWNWNCFVLKYVNRKAFIKYKPADKVTSLITKGF